MSVDWSFATLSSAVVGYATTVNYVIQSLNPYDIFPSVGTVRVGNIMFSELNALQHRTTRALPRRILRRGQLYPSSMLR